MPRASSLDRTSRPEDPQASLGRALEFLQRLWRVDHAMQRVSNRMSRDLGLTGPQRLVIRAVGKRPWLTASALAAMLHLDRGTISAALNRLERKALIGRRSDPLDGRIVMVGLTAKGRRLDRPTEHTIEAAVEQLLRRIPASDRKAAERVLTALADALERTAERQA